MKWKNTIKIIALLLLILLTFTACDIGNIKLPAGIEIPGIGGVEMPELTGVEEGTAKSVLLNKDLIPAIEYEHSETVPEGSVIRTNPANGEKVKSGTTVTLYVSKGPELKIPDIEGLDEDTAKNVLSSNGLIPSVEYVYHDTVKKGNVIGTNPAIGEVAQKNQKITIYVSKGPEYIVAADSRITWWNVGGGEDQWNFYTPYIHDNVLYIECYSVKFAANIKWHDEYSNGRIIGEATLNDTAGKVTPISAVYGKQEYAYNEEQNFTLEIPLNNLDVERPSSVDAVLFAYVNGAWKNIEIRFTITW